MIDIPSLDWKGNKTVKVQNRRSGSPNIGVR